MNKLILAEQNEWQKVREPGRKAGVAARLFLGKAIGKGQEEPARLEAAERKLKVSVGGKREEGSGLQRPPATRGAGKGVGKGWAKGGQRGTSHFGTNSCASPSGKPNSRLSSD